jgi:hypothetical protein
LIEVSGGNILRKFTFQFVFTTAFCWIWETYTRCMSIQTIATSWLQRHYLIKNLIYYNL